MSYCAYITRVSSIRKHPNADRLNIGICFGNQIIVGLDTTEDMLGLYFPTDGQLSEEFCKANNLIRYKDEQGNVKGGLFDHKRKVKTQKLRGEVSDGFWIPVSSLSFAGDISKLKEGDALSEFNGTEICRKYIAPVNMRPFGQGKPGSPRKGKLRSFPIFHEHRDTKQFAYEKNHIFRENDIVYMTLKMHGTSQRTSNTLIVHRLPRWKCRVNRYFYIFRPKTEWKVVTGSRRVVLDSFIAEEKHGYYGNHGFRKKYHDHLENKLHKGETIYYEILGYVDSQKPIVGSCDNKKLNDKSFIDQYGPTTVFSYGCKPGESVAYVYRITMTNEDGHEIDYPWSAVKIRAQELFMPTVPELAGPIVISKLEEALPKIEELVEYMVQGPDPVGVTHIREGVVVRIERDTSFHAYKHKSVDFKILEGIIKESNAVDIEEQQELSS
jgi:hypothetical protein